jgi:hypothetical protein
VKRLLGIGALAACVALAGGAAHAALVKVDNLILTADGGFTPRKLPRRAYAPISFEGHANVRSVDGSIPAPLRQVTIDFDRDGRLSARGLPTCDPTPLQAATVEEARAICARAIVGTGHVEALIAREGQAPAPVRSALTLFNGPPQEGRPTVILHARTTEPAVQILVITIPIERRPGAFRYRATVVLPSIAAGRGALTHIDVKIGRRYRFGGKKRSYVSARCSDSVLSTRGYFVFATEPADTLISGAVEKPCTAR